MIGKRNQFKPYLLGSFFLASLLSACGGSTPHVEAPSGPSWLADLPQKVVGAAPGDRVWAVVPRVGSEAGWVGTFELESATGNEAVLRDDLGNTFEGVPGALIHALGAGDLDVGAVVLGDRWDAAKIVGRVVNVEDGAVEVAFDWNGTTQTAPLESLRPWGAGESGLAPGWVTYRAADRGAARKGFCFAESDTQVWVSSEGGLVEVLSKEGVNALADVASLTPQVGDAVSAYSWEVGYQPGVIAEVIEPGLRYAVSLESGETRSYFFENLTASL